MLAILDAAVALLGRQPGASMEEIAAAAGVSRQTVYAHYPSREALLTAVTHHIAVDVGRRLDGLDLQSGSAIDALGRWIDASWALLQRYPVLLTPAIVVPAAGAERERHEPVIGALTRLIRRGRRSGEFDRAMPTTWYLTAIISLGHAAGQEVIAGRMAPSKAGAAFRESALKVCRRPN